MALQSFKVFQKFIGCFPGVFASSLRWVAEIVLKMGYAGRKSDLSLAPDLDDFAGL
jgi:hypothetical protein